MEQAERVRALIASGGVLMPTTPPSTLPEVSENDDDYEEVAGPSSRAAERDSIPAGGTLSQETISSAASAAAAKAAKAAGAAAATAASLASPRKRAAALAKSNGSGNGSVKSPLPSNVWGQLGNGERDSDCMSEETNISAEGLLPGDTRSVWRTGRR